MAVATAMTAERRPICWSSACRTIVVALASRSGVIGMVACGPLISAGSSRWLGVSVAPLGRPAAASITARQGFTGWALAPWPTAAAVPLAAGPDAAALAAPAVATPPSASAAPRKKTLSPRLGRGGLGRAALLSKDGPFHLFPRRPAGRCARGRRVAGAACSARARTTTARASVGFGEGRRRALPMRGARRPAGTGARFSGWAACSRTGIARTTPDRGSRHPFHRCL